MNNQTKLAATILRGFAKQLIFAPCNDVDLSAFISNAEQRRKLWREVLVYYKDNDREISGYDEELQEFDDSLEEDPDYSPTIVNDSMLLEYIAHLLDPA